MSVFSIPPELPRQLLTVKELTTVVPISEGFLNKDRRTARRIPFIRLGDRILYDLKRVLEALAALEEGGTPIRGKKRKAAA